MLAAGAGITLFKMNLTADSLIEKYPGECQNKLQIKNIPPKPTLPKNWSHGVRICYDELMFPDLTASEREVLVNIRKRKLELLQEISQLKDELTEVNTDIEAMDTEEGAKVRNLQMGKKKFNMDPKKGIEFLIGHNLVKETPEDIAAFLYKGEG